MLVDSHSLVDSPQLSGTRTLERQTSDTPSYCPVSPTGYLENLAELYFGSFQFVSKRDWEIKSVMSVGTAREMHAIKKGLLWQQRERLFSRWKERYFILTKDYLHCFKRCTGLSPMGQFIFKVKLVEVERVEWINKKSYSMIGLSLQGRDSRILLRAEIGLEDWFELLEECTIASKERRQALRKLHDPTWDQDSISLKLPNWLSYRGPDGADSESVSDSISDIQKRRSRSGRETDFWHRPFAENRLSLLTDIDINSCGTPIETPPPSMPATYRGKQCRLNSDVFFRAAGNGDTGRYNGGSITPSFCSGRSVLTPVGSFRSTHLFSATNNVQVKYRDLKATLTTQKGG